MNPVIDPVIEGLKEKISADPSIMGIVREKVITACQGNKRAAQWLQTAGGALWLEAAARYLDDKHAGGKIPP